MKKLLFIAASLSLLLSASAGASTSERGANKRVSMYTNFFTPKSVTIRRGAKVTWTTRRGVHNVSGSTFKSSFLSRGESFSKTFRRSGTYRYVCTLHSGMGGKVIVR